MNLGSESLPAPEECPAPKEYVAAEYEELAASGAELLDVGNVIVKAIPAPVVVGVTGDTV